jgi:serine phosphatase RsbU (regulator of sigma subunit)/DNA-binding GntR family transcriptional regulator
MPLLNQDSKAEDPPAPENTLNQSNRIRLAGELYSGRYSAGQTIHFSEIAERYEADHVSIQDIFTEFQTLGIVSLSGSESAVFLSTDPKDMHEAYEVRAALEEVAGRSAARALKGNTGSLQREFEGMRLASSRADLNAIAEHAVAFHRNIVLASQNEVLLRLWDSLVIDLRVRFALGKVAKHIAEMTESHQPILDALDKGRGREAGLLLRNHVETILAYLKKAEFDSGFQRALRIDLENATEVHKAFLPQEDVSIPGLVCKTLYRPVRYIGGDYYDFFPLDGNRWGIAVGDVCGKGIGAALLMASLQASLRAQAMHPHSDLSALIADVDRLVLASSPKHLYASLFYSEYDASKRLLHYVNAGHNAPMVLRGKGSQCTVFHLKPSGPPLALLEGAEFESKTFQLKQGDLFVAYTDGITEWENPSDELWGERRLESVLRACSESSPERITVRVLGEISDFSKNGTQRDDMTLMVIRVGHQQATRSAKKAAASHRS